LSGALNGLDPNFDGIVEAAVPDNVEIVDSNVLQDGGGG